MDLTSRSSVIATIFQQIWLFLARINVFSILARLQDTTPQKCLPGPPLWLSSGPPRAATFPVFHESHYNFLDMTKMWLPADLWRWCEWTRLSGITLKKSTRLTDRHLCSVGHAVAANHIIAAPTIWNLLADKFKDHCVCTTLNIRLL